MKANRSSVSVLRFVSSRLSKASLINKFFQLWLLPSILIRNGRYYLI